MSSSAVRYGPGRNISIINDVKDLTANTAIRYPIQTLLLNNAEFTAKKSFFRYFKIHEIRLCLFPSGVPSSSFIYANLSWNATQYNDNDIRKDDTTKIAPAYRTRSKVFRWLPIKGVINVNSVSQEIPTNFLDVSEFISTDRVVSLPGWLYVINASDANNAANIEIKVEFRANDYGDLAKKATIKPEEMFIIKEEKIEKPTMNNDLVEDRIYKKKKTEVIQVDSEPIGSERESEGQSFE
jgi:hypothetical protein